MAVRLLDAQHIATVLPKLFEKHDEIHIAAAWGANGSIADSLLQNAHKFKNVIFGVAFCQTDPDLIDRLVGQENAFAADSERGTFHPKLYYFKTGDEAEAIVGSSNFTAGGLGANLEANVRIAGPSKAPIFRDVRAALDTYLQIARPVTKELASAYRLQFDAAKTLEVPKNPTLPRPGTRTTKFTSPLVNMTWHDYVSAVKAAKHHSFYERLALLRDAQTMLAGVGSFADLSSSQWKALAGVIGEKQKKDANLDNHDWDWFGSMKGAGGFANRVAERDHFLAAALDSIPRHGDVDERHYENFCKDFLRAFEHSKRSGDVATATRLLAMKRPDVFVCVSKPNREGIAKALSFAKSTLNLDNYWAKVIEPMQLSPWYNTPKPSSDDGELWEGRAAMLDAIYYNPD